MICTTIAPKVQAFGTGGCSANHINAPGERRPTDAELRINTEPALWAVRSGVRCGADGHGQPAGRWAILPPGLFGPGPAWRPGAGRLWRPSPVCLPARPGATAQTGDTRGPRGRLARRPGRALRAPPARRRGRHRPPARGRAAHVPDQGADRCSSPAPLGSSARRARVGRARPRPMDRPWGAGLRWAPPSGLAGLRSGPRAGLWRGLRPATALPRGRAASGHGPAARPRPPPRGP
jgi:hypothetical protein